MNDILYGIADSIIDGSTFVLNVTEPFTSNQVKYNRWERIRIGSIKPLELDLPQNQRDKAKLEEIIQGRAVRCLIHKREDSGRILADVEII